MKTTTSKLTLDITEEAFENLTSLGLNTGNSVSGLLSMFAADLGADPDNSSPATDLARAWYRLLLSDENKPMTFSLWLSENHYMGYVFLMLTSMLYRVILTLHCTLGDSLSSDERCLLQVEGLMDQALSGSDQPYDDAMELSLNDFSPLIQALIQQNFSCIKALYTEYATDQNVEIKNKSRYAAISDVFRIWKDTVLRY